MGLLRSPSPAPVLPRVVRWGLLALTAGVMTLVPTASEAAGVTVPSTVHLPSTTHKGGRHGGHRGHGKRKFQDCPTQRGGSNDQNGNGRDDRCDTGA